MKEFIEQYGLCWTTMLNSKEIVKKIRPTQLRKYITLNEAGDHRRAKNVQHRLIEELAWGAGGLIIVDIERFCEKLNISLNQEDWFFLNTSYVFPMIGKLEAARRAEINFELKQPRSQIYLRKTLEQRASVDKKWSLKMKFAPEAALQEMQEECQEKFVKLAVFLDEVLSDWLRTEFFKELICRFKMEEQERLEKKV